MANIENFVAFLAKCEYVDKVITNGAYEIRVINYISP